jgi:demethylmenaquinone methyltransferase / 2-methoxy-6-polyprenyl-1,4-benzoquinol methylase
LPPWRPYKEGRIARPKGLPRWDDDEKTTHFGFQDVPEAEKAGMVHGVFTRVASKYDVMNDLMSGGIHRIWKDAMMDWLAPRAGQRCWMWQAAPATSPSASCAARRGHPATVCDMTEPMLIEGRKRAEAERWPTGWTGWWATRWRCPSRTTAFDVYTISFGIRNVTRIEDALAEAFRVLKPGGRLMVLEFSQIPTLMQWAYDRYSFNVIPVMGQVVAGDRDSYQYLVESIRKFPDQETFRRDDPRARASAGEVPQPDDGHRCPAFRLEALRCDARPAQHLAADPHRGHAGTHRRDGVVLEALKAPPRLRVAARAGLAVQVAGPEGRSPPCRPPPGR